MQALVLEDFGRLTVSTVDDPIVGSGDVEVRVIATGICGSDVHGFTGENGRRVRGQVMGHETVGLVHSIGADVERSDLAPGTLVTVNPVILPPEDIETYAGREQHDPWKRVLGVAPELIAAFAERIVVPARNVVILPESMPVLYGALIEPLAVAVNAVRRVDAQPGDAVIVLGGGPIGQSIVLALQMAGVEDILVTEVMDSRRALLERLHVIVVDPREETVPDAAERIFGRHADVALDAVGFSETLNDALSATRLGGRVCLVGMGSPTLTLDAFRISTAERSIIGSFTYSNDDFLAAAEWMAAGPAAAAELISHSVGIDEAHDAFTGLAAGDGTAGKVMVVLDPDRV